MQAFTRHTGIAVPLIKDDINTDQVAPVQAMRALDAMPEVEKTSLFGTAVHAVVRDPSLTPDGLVARLRTSGVMTSRAEQVEPSLEDVFLDVVEKSA